MTKFAIEYLNPLDLIDYDKNAKTHPQSQIDKLAREIADVGFRQPIVIDSSGVICSGHGRKKAAIQLGLQKVPVHRLPKDMAPERVRAMRLFDNKIAESLFDTELLKVELTELSKLDDFDFSLTGFDDDFLLDAPKEFEQIESEDTGEPAEEQATELEREEAQKEIEAEALLDVPIPQKLPTRTKLGDVWKLGRHTLVCGSSMDESLVHSVISKHEAHAIVTDPPYGLGTIPDLEGYIKDWLAGGDGHEFVGGAGFMGKAWDKAVPPPSLWKTWISRARPGAHALVFSGTRTQDLMTLGLRLAGFEIRDQMAWLFASGFPKSQNIKRALEKEWQCKLEKVHANYAENLLRLSGEVKGTHGQDFVVVGVWDCFREKETLRFVNIAEKISTPQEPLLNVKVVENKALFVVESAKENGRKILRGKIIQTGKAEDFKEATDTSLFSATTENIDLSTTSLWKNLSGEASGETKMCITLTLIEVTTELKIFNFLQNQNTVNSIFSSNHTALKPSLEPISLVRIPLSEDTIVKNVLKWETGGLNIAGCRVGSAGATKRGSQEKTKTITGWTTGHDVVQVEGGRWPANTLLDEVSAQLLDEQVGPLPGPWGGNSKKSANGKSSMFGIGGNCENERFKDGIGASRFFYVAKSSKSERNGGISEDDEHVKSNGHATVKPLTLMKMLVRLVCPEGGTVLEPFCGSGTTLLACELEGFTCKAFEFDPSHCDIILARFEGMTGLKAELLPKA